MLIIKDELYIKEGEIVNKNYHYLIMSNHSIFNKKVQAALEGTGLTSGQPKILDYLSVSDGCKQKDIAYGCQIDPATVTGLLNRMEDKGLIERKSSDRRSLHVYLTEAGREKAAIVEKIFNELEEEVLGCLTEEEKNTLILTLDKIFKHTTIKGDK